MQVWLTLGTSTQSEPSLFLNWIKVSHTPVTSCLPLIYTKKIVSFVNDKVFTIKNKFYPPTKVMGNSEAGRGKFMFFASEPGGVPFLSNSIQTIKILQIDLFFSPNKY